MRTVVLIGCVLASSGCSPTEPPPSPLEATPPSASPADPVPPSDPTAPADAAPATSAPAAAAGAPACSRSPADIMGVVGRHSQAINKCLVAGQKHKSLTKGTRTVDLDFTVVPSGRIEDVQVHEKDIRDDSLQVCLTKVLKGMRFRKIKGGPCPMSLPLNVAKPSPFKRLKKR